MNDTENIKCFMFTMTKGYLQSTREIGELEIDAELVFNKYMELHPNSKYPNIGYFMRTANRICKQLDNITTKSERINGIKYHAIILYSDMRTHCPFVISDIDDIKIKFITDMKVSDPQSDRINDIPIINIAPVTPCSKPTDIPTQSIQYPLLQSLGVVTNFDTNKEQLVNLMSELVFLFKNENKPLNFVHRGNDRPGLLIPVPKSKNYETFDRMQRKEKWLEHALEFLNKNFSEDVTTYWLFKHVHKKFPHVFIKMASDLGLIVVQKMTDVEASAMWVEANVSYHAARIILRHLQVKFGRRLQVPFSQIALLSNVTNKIEPVFEEFLYKKDETSQTSYEKIKYWTINPLNLIEHDFARLLSSMQGMPKFGYESKLFPPNKKGAYSIIGADHGGGKSRYLIRINYLHSSYRRAVNKVDAGTRTIQFAEVSCKKDVHEIQSKIAPIVNQAIKGLETSMLIAIKIHKCIQCKFLPCESINITTTTTDTKSVVLMYTIDSNTVSTTIKFPEPIYKDQNHPVHIWTVIGCFKTVIAGDLSFFATSTGRDGHSHCRCAYCDGSYQSWNDETSPPPQQMTLSTLHQLATLRLNSKKPKQLDTKGVVMKPLFDIEPCFYIVPLLHLLIGVVNKLWSSLLLFLEEFVEKITIRESDLKESIKDSDRRINAVDEEMEVLTVNKQMACEEYAITNSIDAKNIINCTRDSIKKQKELKAKLNQALRKYKKDLVSERLKRKGDIRGMEHLLHEILEQSNIKKQHIHGGSMNRVCCRRLLDNTDEIFDKIRNVISDKINNQNKSSQVIHKITLMIQKFQDLFELVDLVFYRLRILDPTPEEMKETKKAIGILSILWKEIELKKGPKLHILFDHAMVQVMLFKGIADLVEDFVEKFHQVGKQLDHLVARMSAKSFRQQEMVKIRRQWLTSNPLVCNHIDSVNMQRKRNINDLPNIQRTKKLSAIKQERKRVKREKTERKQSHFDAV